VIGSLMVVAAVFVQAFVGYGYIGFVVLTLDCAFLKTIRREIRREDSAPTFTFHLSPFTFHLSPFTLNLAQNHHAGSPLPQGEGQGEGIYEP
jgi:hypothetical protein